ncbi:MAG TPA: hypothetical protein VHO25_12410, partial [Polyangiaceae bacterium]|nr:hypothetical protein [Polyangiaceae bacterium]
MSRFRIAAVSRGGQSAGTEELAFDPGVNVVVGIKDTGKTTWLRILSFLLGDARTPRQALGRPIEQGFDWVSARLILETGEELLLQRSWRKRDLASKISVGEELIEASEFSAWFARQLRIPEVTFPKGDPLVTDTWLALSWRMLFSHVLRDEDHWTEVVADQSPSEQL